MSYFLDASSMLSIAKGNPNFEKFMNEELITSIHNLHELHSKLLKETTKEKAEFIFSKFRPLAVEVEDSHLIKASHIMHESETSLSHGDSIGLAISKERDIKLLTSNPSLKEVSGTLFIE